MIINILYNIIINLYNPEFEYNSDYDYMILSYINYNNNNIRLIFYYF